MRRGAGLLLALLASSAFASEARAAPETGPGYSRFTSPELRRFGTEAEFLAFLDEARAAAHALGDWWYASLRIDFAQAGTGEAASWGLEVLPGSHGDYDFEQASVPGGTVYYSHVDLTQIRPGVDPVWPGLRRRGRVVAGDSFEEPDDLERGARRHPLWRAGEIFRPVRDTLEPTIHSITFCPDRAVEAGRPAGCRTTAFVAARGGRFHVDATHAYLWSVPELGDLEALGALPDCAARVRDVERNGLPALVYRLPTGGGALEVLGVRGEPAWGSGFHVADGRLRAMVAWPKVHCGEEPREQPGEPPLPPARFTLLDAPLSLFARRLVDAPRAFEAELPMTRSAAIRVRFHGGALLYGDLAYEFAVPWQEDANLSSELVVVPVGRPPQASRVQVPHSLVSIAVAGRFALLTGYRDRSGLSVSTVRLGPAPRLVSTVVIPGRRQQSGPAETIPVRDLGGESSRIDVPTVAVDAVLPEGPRGDRPGEQVSVLVAPDGTLSIPVPPPPRR